MSGRWAFEDTGLSFSSKQKGKKTQLGITALFVRNSPNSTSTTSTIGDTVLGNILNADGEVVANFIAQYITQSPSECSTAPGGCLHSLTDAEECSIEAYANATKIDGAHSLPHDHSVDGKWQIYILDTLNSTDTNTVYMHNEEGEPFACSNLEPIATQEEVDELNQVLTDVLREQLVVAAAAANNTALDANTTTTGEYESLSGDSTNAAGTTDTTSTTTEGEVAVDVTPTPTPGFDPNLPLPPYLAPLPESDPQWASLNSSAYEYAYGPNPGDGNLKSFQIVTFIQSHTAYRVWGGPSSECGYWWMLADADNCVKTCPRISNQEYRDVFAVCPSWNNMTNITVVDIPVNTTAVVGIGQSAACPDGSILQPIPGALQLNGNACEMASNEYESCPAFDPFLALSSCVKRCPDSVAPLKTPDGAYECVSDSPVIADTSSSASLLAKEKGGNVFLTIIVSLLVARVAGRK